MRLASHRFIPQGIVCALLTFAHQQGLFAQTSVWTGGGSNANWSTPQNWNPVAIPASDGSATITMAGSTQLSPNVDVPWNINALTFDNTAYTFTLGGSTLTIGSGGITQGSQFIEKINNSISLSADQTWSDGTNSNAYLLTYGSIATNGHALTLAGAGAGGGLINGAISGSGSVILSSSWAVYGSNTFTGGLYLNSGNLFVNSDQSLGASGRPIVFNGGSLEFGEPAIVNRDITLNTGAAIYTPYAQYENLALQGNIHGAGSLSLSGGGASYITLGGSNSYTGGTYVNEVTLAGTTSTIQGNVTLSNIYAQIEFDQTTNGTYSGNISGGGEALFDGPGLVALTGTNTYTSDTQIYNGGIEAALSGSGLSPTSRMIFEGGGGVIQIVGGGTFARPNNTNPGGVFWNLDGGFSARNGKLTVNLGGGSAQFTLLPHCDLDFGSPNANSVTEFQNPIFLGSDESSPSPAISVNKGTGGDYALISGAISGGNGLLKYGAGTLQLSASNSYTGPTSVSAGALIVNGSLAKTAITVSGGATLGGTGSIAGSVNISAGSTSLTRGAINLVDGSINTLTLSDPASTDTVLTLGGTSGKSSQLNFEVGSTADKIAILVGKINVNTGGALINITALSGFNAGTYDLIDFPTGQATGLNHLTLSTMTVSTQFHLSLQDTSTAVQLVVVPEPSSFFIFAVTAGCLAFRRRRAC
jgi:autotransporter-associated beta strand protein